MTNGIAGLFEFTRTLFKLGHHGIERARHVGARVAVGHGVHI